MNNAGYGYRSSFEEGGKDSVNQLFITNFFGPMELIKNKCIIYRSRELSELIFIIPP